MLFGENEGEWGSGGIWQNFWKRMCQNNRYFVFSSQTVFCWRLNYSTVSPCWILYVCFFLQFSPFGITEISLIVYHKCSGVWINFHYFLLFFFPSIFPLAWSFLAPYMNLRHRFEKSSLTGRDCPLVCQYHQLSYIKGTQRQFLENICSEVRFVKFLACPPLLGFSNSPKNDIIAHF